MVGTSRTPRPGRGTAPEVSRLSDCQVPAWHGHREESYVWERHLSIPEVAELLDMAEHFPRWLVFLSGR